VAYKNKLSDIRIGDRVDFATPGAGTITGTVAEIRKGGQTFPTRSRVFLDADQTVLNRYPDAGTDVTILTQGPPSPPTPEEAELQRKYNEEFGKFDAKPVGSMYMLSSHKSTGTVLIKISDTRWVYYDYSGYGGYDAYTMGNEEAFNYCYDSIDGYFFADEMEVSGV
jgi:hypothetical protein